MKRLILLFGLLSCCVLGFAAEKPAIEGYWQIVEDNDKPEGIAVVYSHNGMYYCRMVALYDDDGKEITETIAAPKEKATGLKGNPTLCGLDFIWDLKPMNDSNGRYRGTVIDPDNGNTYTCKVWFDAKRGTLVVRGEWLIFGENEYWPPISIENVPKEAQVNVDELTPVIPTSS